MISEHARAADTRNIDPAAPRVVVHELASDHARPGRTALLRRISWGAVIGGTLVAMSLQLLFTTLGTGIGFAAIEPAIGDDPGEGFAVGAGIWWLVTGLISLGGGGWVAGRLGGFPNPIDATLHGLLVWATTAVLGAVFVTTTAAGLMGGAVGPLAEMMSRRAGQMEVRGDGVLDNTTGGIAAIGNEALRRATQPNAGNAANSDQNRDGSNAADRNQSATDAGVRDQVTGAQPSDTASLPAGTDRTTTDVPVTEAEARQTADEAADALAATSVVTFFALLLGAIAAAAGGRFARPPAVVAGDPALV
jgi:hypothetical protein